MNDEQFRQAVEEAATKPRIKGYLRWMPPILRVLGIVILAGTILLMIPMVGPSVVGMKAFEITTGSMEPEIPVGSLVIVKQENPASISDGSVIAFDQGGTTIVHRVVRNQTVEGRIYTKGDANEQQDKSPVSYDDVQGVMLFNAPVLGSFYSHLSSMVGKVYVLMMLVAGVLCCILASQLASKRRILEGEDADSSRLEASRPESSQE